MRAIERVDAVQLVQTLQAYTFAVRIQVRVQRAIHRGERLHAVVAEMPLEPDAISQLKSFASKGGCVILSLARPVEDAAKLGAEVEELLELPGISHQRSGDQRFFVVEFD